MRWVWLVAMCACATAQPPRYREDVERTFHRTSGKQVPASEEFGPHRWKLGQWALYRRERGRSVETFTVVAEETCGVWILRQVVDARRIERWWLCFRRHDDADLPDAGMGISVRDFDPPRVFVVDREPLARQLPWIAAIAASGPAGETDREDVDVPAGHFTRAIRTPTAWIHPAVPFAGIVKDGERELVDFGDHDAPSAIQQLGLELAGARERRRSRFSGAIGTGPTVTGDTMTVTTHATVQMTRQLDVATEAASDGRDLAGNGDVFLLAGLQWNPFGRAHAVRGFASAEAIYLRAAVGFAMLLEPDGEIAGIGAAGGAAIGWLPLQGRDWAAGVELDTHVSLLNANVGERHSASVIGLVQLYLPH